MQNIVEVKEVSNTERKISINVPADLVDKQFDKFFEEIKAHAVVPGFRKGKAPVSRLKQVFAQKARPSVSQMLINEYYTKAISEHEINPVGNPVAEDMKTGDEYPGKFGFDNSYSVSLTVEVLPKVDPTGYIGMSLDFPKHDENELFDAIMKNYREQFAERKQVSDRGAQLGDSIVIDFQGFIDDKPFDGGAAQGFSIESLGGGSFIPGFEEQILGMKPGESKNIFVTFPEEYRATHLAGKDAKFIVKVGSIVEIKLADVDEDLAMMVGFETVDELNENVKKESERERQARDRLLLDKQITEKLLEANDIDAPESMVQKEMLRLLGKNKLQSLPPQAQDELKTMAEYNVKRAIVMDAIYEKEEELEVTPEELNKMLEEHAARGNQSKDELVSNLYNSGQMDNFVGVLRLSNTMDFIINNAKQESEEGNDGRSNEGDDEEASSDGI